MNKDIKILDAHHHFWDLDKNYYPFLSDKIDNDFFLGDYSSIDRRTLNSLQTRVTGHHNVPQNRPENIPKAFPKLP